MGGFGHIWRYLGGADSHLTKPILKPTLYYHVFYILICRFPLIVYYGIFLYFDGYDGNCIITLNRSVYADCKAIGVMFFSHLKMQGQLCSGGRFSLHNSELKWYTNELKIKLLSIKQLIFHKVGIHVSYNKPFSFL